MTIEYTRQTPAEVIERLKRTARAYPELASPAPPASSPVLTEAYQVAVPVAHADPLVLSVSIGDGSVTTHRIATVEIDGAVLTAAGSDRIYALISALHAAAERLVEFQNSANEREALAEDNLLYGE